MTRQSTSYQFNGLAGCVVQRVSRVTRMLVGLYFAEQAGLCADSGPWATVCEVHSSICNHETLALARSHLPDPTAWCEECQAAAAAPAPTPTVKPWSHPDYQKNAERAGEREPCAICGKGIRNLKRAVWIYVSVEGEWLKSEEGFQPNSQGAFPIGRECWRKHKPALQDFVAQSYRPTARPRKTEATGGTTPVKNRKAIPLRRAMRTLRTALQCERCGGSTFVANTAWRPHGIGEHGAVHFSPTQAETALPETHCVCPGGPVWQELKRTDPDGQWDEAYRQWVELKRPDHVVFFHEGKFYTLPLDQWKTKLIELVKKNQASQE